VPKHVEEDQEVAEEEQDFEKQMQGPQANRKEAEGLALPAPANEWTWLWPALQTLWAQLLGISGLRNNATN